MIQKAQNYSAYSELLHVFRITQHIQNYSAYSPFTWASRKASPERLTFRSPVGRPQCVSRTNTCDPNIQVGIRLTLVKMMQ